MSKVIDLLPRLKTVAPEKHQSILTTHPTNHEVVQFEEQRQKILFQERRQVKRTILSEVVSIMVVIPEKGLLKVDLYDISEEGLSFDLASDEGQFKIGEEILVRVYLNQKTYFPLQMTIKHVTFEKTENVLRHGAEYLSGVTNDVALQHFIRFIETVGQSLKKDSGDFMVTRTS